MSETTRSQKWWRMDNVAAGEELQSSPQRLERPARGQPCPKCLMEDLDYDTLFRLHCPNCGYIAECGAFT